MQVYQTDSSGVFLGAVAADPDPMEPGNWLVPGGCVTTPPPAFQAGQRARWNGGAWLVEQDDVAPPPAPPSAAPTGEDVNQERDFRILKGATFDVAGIGPVRLIGRDVDMRNLVNLALAAQLRIASGMGAVITPFRDADNVIHSLTQPQVLDLWSQGSAYVSAIYEASWALKAAAIPPDYAEDSHWP